MLRTTCSTLALFAALTAAPLAAQEAPILQPGAPGQDSRAISSDEASRIADSRYVAADVAFMQGMIHHHWQAVEMAELVADRTNNEDVIALAERISASQDDEIAFMREWLMARGEDAPDPAEMARHAAMGHATHGGQGAHMAHMAGMATPEQMAALAAASGVEFDRMFLTLMAAHHDGALQMVNDLFNEQGSANDPVLFAFANDVRGEQMTEIVRMDALLTDLSVDPRATLRPGLFDAEIAISGLRHVAELRKPAGFFDPANPGGFSGGPAPAMMVRSDPAETGEAMQDMADRDAADAVEAAMADGDTPEGLPVIEEVAKAQGASMFGGRPPLLSFSNTDMAFSGDIMVAGNYHGFNIYRLGDDGVPSLISSAVCPGGQGDVSVVGDLLIMSVEQTRGRVDCGGQGVSGDVSPDRFRGLRIFDISDLTRPRQVGLVQTCRGSHTHSIVSADDETILVYNSGTAGVRDDEELAGCVDGLPGDENTALFSIDVIEIPVANPGAARIVSSPRVFANYETGEIAGLWRGGNHGAGTQDTRRTDQCHDITVFPSANIAAGACSGNGILLDISDPRDPVRIDDVTENGFAYWHSATFNNDGTKVLFTDEWGGGGRARCRTFDPLDWGADAIYDIVDGELTFRSTYKLPAPQTEQENCVAHNGSIVPVPGRDVFVQAWYQGGISVIDFTDSANPVEIAYFDRGPLSATASPTGGFWSAYYYGGRIYGTEIVRGLDVFALEPTEHLTANEIAAAALATNPGDIFNPQTQNPVSWPTDPVVALALVDGLERRGALDAGDIARLRSGIEAENFGDLAGWVRRRAAAAPADRALSLLAEQIAAMNGG